MKAPLSTLLILVIGLLWLLAQLGGMLENSGRVGAGAAERALLDKARRAAAAVDSDHWGNQRQRGGVKVADVDRLFADTELDSHLFEIASRETRARTYMWHLGGIRNSAATARAPDDHHYFVNSYLVGFQPFAVEHPWMPFYVVASRKKYQYDKFTYGLDDVWQNSAQAYVATRGDCEDHALLLADWLIESGIDARVVLGTYKNNGHAWVVAHRNGKVFLLEATDKRKRKSWRAYPLAALAADYRPEFMFNRQYSWISRDASKPRDYLGDHWQQVSRFIPSTDSEP